MKKKWLAVGALLTGFALVAASCGEKKDTATPADTGSGAKVDKIKAAWIYIGPADDGGWTQAHDAGRKSVEAALGDKVETTIKESVPEDGAEAGQVIEDLIKDGNKIIFATSFNYGKAMAAAAKAHPDVYFEHAAGADTTENLAVYYGAGEDSNYLAAWPPERRPRPARSASLPRSRSPRSSATSTPTRSAPRPRTRRRR